MKLNEGIKKEIENVKKIKMKKNICDDKGLRYIIINEEEK